MKDHLVEFQKLELVAHSKSTDQSKSNFAAKLSHIWNRIVEFIINAVNVTNEPEIYSRKNKFGDTYWVVYDPLLRQKMFFGSEAEVRNHLDCRYYS